MISFYKSRGVSSQHWNTDKDSKKKRRTKKKETMKTKMSMKAREFEMKKSQDDFSSIFQ